MSAVHTVNVIGAGLAGLAAAIRLAELCSSVRLVSLQDSERAQSVLAAGGINGALDTMGEGDSAEEHFADTMRAGQNLADEEAVRDLAEHAPEILHMLDALGVPFNRTPDGRIRQRNFGGQKKKRTAFAKSSTGRMLMSALIDEARKYEAAGRIARYPHHEFLTISLRDFAGARRCAGAYVRDSWTDAVQFFEGPVICAFGGINGFFPGKTTGTTANSGDAAAELFALGVRFSNLEMIQYHPTTMGIAGKRCLVSEAARGEGGRLFVLRNGEPWFFMDEKYPELGSLMPRDVVSREMELVLRDPANGGQVYLDMRHLTKDVWSDRLADLREELLHYFHLDPAKEPLPVEPGIHYFMGGIDVDRQHRTGVRGLYAAGECCSQYHGANRLGGNSTLGAIYGGRVAAESCAAERDGGAAEQAECAAAKEGTAETDGDGAETAVCAAETERVSALLAAAAPDFAEKISGILLAGLGIVRSEEKILLAEEQLRDLAAARGLNRRERSRVLLAEAMLLAAERRRESRGAHFREDYPEKDAALAHMSCAVCEGG